MGGITSVLGPVMALSSGASLASSILGKSNAQSAQEQALKQLQAQQNLQYQVAQENAALEKQQIALEAQNSEEERKRALRRAVARQKTIFGSSGIGGQGGSSQAVLLGLMNESDEERQQREALDTLKTAAIDSDLAQQKRLNVLQRTQLQEKNKLDDVSSSLSYANDVFSLFG